MDQLRAYNAIMTLAIENKVGELVQRSIHPVQNPDLQIS